MTVPLETTVRGEDRVPGGRRILLDLHRGRIRCPAILLRPDSAAPAPSALLLHGLHLEKARMSEFAGLPLLRRGIASLALDLPLHGERRGSVDPAALLSPFEMMRHWRLATEEASLALRYLAESPGLDPSRIGLVGYSLGGFLGLKIASLEARVRALVLAAWGDLPDYTPFISVVRAFVDPLKLVRRLQGRPLLMLHGRLDHHITPAQAQRLFDAAAHPKEIAWFESAHALPPEAVGRAADWLAAGFGTGARDDRFWAALV